MGATKHATSNNGRLKGNTASMDRETHNVKLK
jgi:hypothetical protein